MGFIVAPIVTAVSEVFAGIGTALGAGAAAEAGAVGALGALGAETGAAGAIGTLGAETAGFGGFGGFAGSELFGLSAGGGGFAPELGLAGLGEFAGAGLGTELAGGFGAEFAGLGGGAEFAGSGLAGGFELAGPEFFGLGAEPVGFGADAFGLGSEFGLGPEFGLTEVSYSPVAGSEPFGALGETFGAAEASPAAFGESSALSALGAETPLHPEIYSEFGQVPSFESAAPATGAPAAPEIASIPPEVAAPPGIEPTPYYEGGAAGLGGEGASGLGAGLGRGGLGMFNPGALLNSLMQMRRPNIPSLGAANAAAARLQAQAEELLNRYNQGVLSPAMMAKVQNDLQAALNKVRQFYSRAGRYNSTDRIKAEQEATFAAMAAMAASLDRELQLGLQSLGQAGSLYVSAANAAIAADNAYRSSMSNALNSILRIPFGGGAQSLSLPSLAMPSYGVEGGGGFGGEVGGEAFVPETVEWGAF